jgi:nitroreductase
MDVKKAIEKRKSIRKFKEMEVPDKIIKEVIDAARRAPSSRNQQPWRFIVVKKKDFLKFKEQRVFVSDWIYEAPVVIVCCSEKDDEEHMSIINISLASAFLVLEATELGLGTCFVARLDKEKIKNILGIPKDIIIPYVIVMGYPDEEPETKERKKLEEIMSFEKW